MLRRVSALPILAVLGVALLPAAPADATTTCTSGKTLRKDADARVFSVPQGSNEMRIYACRTRSRKPTLLYEDGGYPGDLEILERQGTRVVYVVDICCSGDSAGASVVGWFDVRTGALRTRGDEGSSPSAVAVAPDGAVVVDRDSQVSVLRPGAGKHVLAAPRRIGTSELPLVPASLRIKGDRVTWTTKAGTRATVGLDGTPVVDPDPSPVCHGIEVTVKAGETVTIPLACEDTGPEEGRTPVTVRLNCRSCDGPPGLGDLGRRQPGPPVTVTYTARKGAEGRDGFAFVANDAHSISESALVKITVVAG